MYEGGYCGKILRINLTEQKAYAEDLPPEIAEDYIGGVGFGLKILFDEVEARVDPLGPDNKLIFAPGPLTGTTIPCTSRMAVIGKSPLTGVVGAAFTGGYFPAEMKFAGYDAIIVEGKAKKPTYVWIKDNKIDFRSAGTAWGMKTTDTQQVIKNEIHEQNARIACIGPAGENLSKMACIINERRAAGRRGLGAVMGSKNLKAIAVRGTSKVAVADKDKYKVARAEFTKAMKDSPRLYSHFSKMGTSGGVNAMSALGIFPAKNYSATGSFVPVEEIGADALNSRKVGRESCYNCPVACAQLRVGKTGAYTGIMTEGPEFETMYAYGGMTGVTNVDSIIAADRLADELGLDTMSSGATIAFAMELFEKGLLTEADTGGIELKFGNHEAMLTMLRLMAYREGIGDLLADGSRVMAKIIGKDSEKFAMHVKGLELPGYDVRGAKAHGLNYATSYTGADHNRGYSHQEIMGIPVPYKVDRFVLEGKGKLTKWNQDTHIGTKDSATMCGFVMEMSILGHATQTIAKLLEATTGLPFTPEAVQKVGERATNLARAFNVREGFSRKDDTLPERIMKEPLKEGSAKGELISQDDLNFMLDEYYAERGWDISTGIPTKKKLKELGLDYVINEIL